MIWVFLVVSIVVLAFFLRRQERRWLSYGRLVKRGVKTINKHRYYYEDVEFEDYQEALHNYFKVVADIESYDDSIETKYDLYDWTYSVHRFTSTTIELRHIRPLRVIRFVRSLQPISIEEFERDNPSFN